MTDTLLALNVGSSSIKFSLFALRGDARAVAPLYRGAIEGLGAVPHFAVWDAAGGPMPDASLGAAPTGVGATDEALGLLLGWIERHESGLRLVATGHRVVHGGMRYLAPVVVGPAVLDELEQLVPLAPLHQPHNLAGIRALAARRPDLPQVACFDTAFHCTQPAVAQAFALPGEVTDLGVRRYGFHGLSYEYIAGALPAFLGTAAEGRVVVAHLGAGASMCALLGRRSVATTMGFTALDGLPMGTRSGALDPGVVLYLLQTRGMDLRAVTDLLYHRSGLLGVSGLSPDVRDLLASDAPGAAAALDLFVYRCGRELGSLAAALGGLDALVFTAGIGEHAAPIRARICRDASWLGMRLDDTANARHGPRISADDSAVSAWVIPTDEDRVIAEHTRALLG